MPRTRRGPGRPRAGETPVAVVKHFDQAEALQKAYGLVVLNPPQGHKLPDNWANDLPQDITAAQRYRDWILAGMDPATEPDVLETDKRAARLSVGRAPGGQGRRPAPAN